MAGRAGQWLPRDEPPARPDVHLAGGRLGELGRLPRDHYVRLDSNDYSVHPSAVGRLVEAHADLQTVTVTLSGRDGARQVAQHERCWASHQTLTDLQHQQAAAAMRAELSRQHRQPTPDGQQVEQRQLTDYGAAFGLATVECDAAAVA